MTSPRQFAIDVTRRLQDAGFQALWAGGCVRDELMGAEPKDYDVATSAKPDEIRDLFGRRRTIAIGAAFGVISVIGPKSAGNIEVVTFRSDAQYSDGRHPDSVTFSTAEQDALRRDFTVNGLFFDPIQEKVIDYVGGQRDLQARVIRAIGNPGERIDEDKLRMLRAVRFASTLEFKLDARTQSVIKQHAAEIVIVSAERIAGEIERMLIDKNRSRAARLLFETDLLRQILPESSDLDGDDQRWHRTLALLEHLNEPTFATALAALISEIASPDDVATIGERWRLPNQVIQTTRWLLEFTPLVLRSTDVAWSKLQPVLIDPRVEELLQFVEARTNSVGENNHAVNFCRERLAWPSQKINPDPLINGDDLISAGHQPGPAYSLAIESARRAQLDGEIETKADALELARKIIEDPGNT